MKAVNLYILTRTTTQDIKALYEKALSNREKEIKVREEEYCLIGEIVNNLIAIKADIDVFERWFYSFTIPQIGKEFDLVKIGKNQIINIELKSREVPDTKIIRQLEKNRMYLTHICKEIHSFTYVGDQAGASVLYKYENGLLKKSSFEELLHHINGVIDPIDEGIEKLFRPGDYLISPINTPDKFLNGQYYLNNNQSYIKKEILSHMRKKGKIFGIKGSAGTGKTLLMYDLARELSSMYKICIIHSGVLSEGHKYLNEKLENITIIEEKSLTEECISELEVICVDESQRLTQKSLDILLESCNEEKIKACIFLYDFAQVLSKSERIQNNPDQLQQIENFKEYRLKNRIRTNPDIISFVRTALRLYDVPEKNVDYSNIEIVLANDITECDRILKIYRERGYTFITFTPSYYASSDIEQELEYKDSHLVIGQEFDHVVQIMDNNFRYSSKGELQARKHPDRDCLFSKLFYQNITRAREKLCIIVLNNQKLFDALLMIKEHRYTELGRKYIRSSTYDLNDRRSVRTRVVK